MVAGSVAMVVIFNIFVSLFDEISPELVTTRD
jgi:hypothetical protein